jgi:tRNA pseudouridine55 synthase
LRIEGKRAYEYARLGKELPRELEKRPVKVANLELIEWYDQHSFPAPLDEASEEEKSFEQKILKRKLQYKTLEETTKSVQTDGPACKLRMTVSGGFYVRSLCYDLGLKLDSGAYMAELARTRQGDFRLEDSVPWEELVEGGAWEDKVVRVLKGEASGNKDQKTEKKDEKADPKSDGEES